MKLQLQISLNQELIHAINTNDIARAKMALANGADRNSGIIDISMDELTSPSPFMIACAKFCRKETESFAMIDLLLKKGANPNKTNCIVPIEAILRKSYLDNESNCLLLLEKLKNAGMEFKIACNTDYANVVHCAIFHGINGVPYKVIDYIVNQSLQPAADHDILDDKGKTPLMHLVQCDVTNYRMKLVALLIGLKIDLNKKSKTKQTALIYAAKNKDVHFLKLLLAVGSDHTVSTRSGKNALYFAKAKKNLAAINLLNDPQAYRQFAMNDPQLLEMVGKAQLKEMIKVSMTE